VAEQLVRVELTASFLDSLDAVEASLLAFLLAANAGFAFDTLLA
jgi:hypothetical protein